VNQLALAINKGVRVGLEDNLFIDEHKKVLASNIKLVERIKQICKISGKSLATALEMREILQLNQLVLEKC